MEVDLDLEVYRRLVRDLLNSNSEQLIPNEKKEYACIILEEMLKACRTKFYAIVNSLKDDVWTVSVMEQLKNAIERGVDVRIALVESCIQINNFDQCVFNHIRHITSTVPVQFNASAIDDRAFRFEPDMDDRGAIFCANHKELALKISQAVLRLYDVGEPCKNCEA